MIKELQKKNTDIKIYSVADNEFNTFGRIINNIDTTEIVKVAESFDVTEGITYIPSVKEFENLAISKEINNELYGTLPTQIGYCYGHSSYLNATEWHTSNEVNIAITDLVLILGHRWDIVDDKIDSSMFKAFYVPKGTIVEVYSTSLHYCPCQVSDNGFRCIVALPKDTNTELDLKLNDKRITAKNKWLLAHVDNEVKIKQGAVPGITGINSEVKY